MKLRRRIARFNKRVTNPIQSRWAWLIPPYAIVLHSGRRSGRGYRTPVMARFAGDDVSIRIMYGPESDWVRNLVAGGGGEIVRGGRTFELLDPRIDGHLLRAKRGAPVGNRDRRGFPLAN